MISFLSLALPIFISAIVVFLASSIIHMVLKYHNSDFKSVPKEDELMDAMRPFNLQPGIYIIPRAENMEAMKSEEYLDKVKKGPVAMLTMMETGQPKMGKSLAQWFVYCLVVSFFAAYISSRALGPEAHYLSVFRFVGSTAFVGYALALWQNSIWYRHTWSITIKSTIDGFIYALLTAGVFGWLWPTV